LEGTRRGYAGTSRTFDLRAKDLRAKKIRGTEGLRRAMLYYRAVIVEMAGKPEDRERAREGRREIAS
jgi:hypothetical protein